MKTKVYIRVDGGAKIGLGHLVRCIALAYMIKEDFDITFVCHMIPQEIIDEIEVNSWQLVLINHEKEFFSFLKKESIVVIDGYHFNTAYQKSIKDYGAILVCIDDVQEDVFFADLIINHAPNINIDSYKAQVYTQFALGLDYALLRPVFLNTAKKRIKNKENVESVFICFGGSDSKNITRLVADILKQDKRFKKIDLVVGASYSFLNDIKQLIKDDKRFKLYHSISSQKMCNLIEEAELAIVPASGILQEVLAVGCTVISGMYVENQKKIYSNYKALGAFISAEDFSIQNILKSLNEYFEIPYKMDNKFIDGKSNERLLNLFKQFE